MKTVALLLVASTAHADPCDDALTDPVATPLRDVAIDAQRGACTRSQATADLVAHALIDNPGFHGQIGGELDLGARLALPPRFEIGAQLRLVDLEYVVNAVNVVTDAQLGPLVLTGAVTDALGAHGRIALVGAVEVPATRSETDTTRVAWQLTGVASMPVATAWVAHARMGAVSETATSLAGTTTRLSFRAGGDLAWHATQNVALSAGADVGAGWYGRLDEVLVRLGARFQLRGAWRAAVGVGLPLGGHERTTVVGDFGLTRDL